MFYESDADELRACIAATFHDPKLAERDVASCWIRFEDSLVGCDDPWEDVLKYWRKTGKVLCKHPEADSSVHWMEGNGSKDIRIACDCPCEDCEAY